MICAGDLKDGKDACQGDSGGPLQMPLKDQTCMWSIFGLTSFGKQCGNPKYPANISAVRGTGKPSSRNATATVLEKINKPLVRVQGTPSPRNATAVAIQKCQEYTKLQVVSKWQSPQRAGDVGYFADKQDCVNVVTLIVGGAPAVPKEYPHMALIGYGNKYSELQWGCGGSLISERFIMSAAHCGQNSVLGPPRWALLGDLTLSSKKDDARPVTYSIVRVYDHPDYKAPAYYHDISLFELNTTVKMSAYVRPACLHTSMTDLTAVAKYSINDKLLKAAITVVSDQQCKISYNGIANKRLERGYDSDGMLCAGDLQDGNDTCQGDSGGPMQTIQSICMWKIVGVTSFGPGICGNTEDPGVYTRVAYYISWIQSIVWP
ncbi:serine-type endopeptidase [Sarracenia purpurea var. burkii]